METSKKWYQSSFGIIALLVLFFPAGLFLMWAFANWNKWVKVVVTGIFVAIIISGVVNDSKKEVVNAPSVAPVAQTKTQNQQTQTVNYAFDIPSLVGKDIDGVEVTLGKPKDGEPTAQQLRLGVKEWNKTFIKNGKELLVTYTVADRKIVDFFISTDDPSGKTTNTAHLLELGNLKQYTSSYLVDFVKTIKDPGAYTGVKITPY